MTVAAPPIVAILGPTGAGKTAFTFELAQCVPIEVISLDSAQVYRGMDVGTAKPSRAERQAIPHHLIDVRDFWEPYSAADFAHDAARAIREIHQRGALPVVSGGTFLYLRALRDGLSDLPQGDAEVRTEISARAEALGWPALHAELAQVDPATAARLSPQDAQRIQRALEIHQITGRPMSEQLANSNPDSGLQWCHVVLNPDLRARLHQKIEARLDAMLADGFRAEVAALMAHERFAPDLPAMRAVGYRQIIEHLIAGSDPAEARLRVLYATRQLAKRQLTWLRKEPVDRGLDPDDASARRAVIQWLVNRVAPGGIVKKSTAC